MMILAARVKSYSFGIARKDHEIAFRWELPTIPPEKRPYMPESGQRNVVGQLMARDRNDPSTVLEITGRPKSQLPHASQSLRKHA